jgi:hypothetical protein
MPTKKYHIVSAWVHPDDRQSTHRLVLTYDSTNPTTPILLDEAADSKDGSAAKNQIWEVAQSVKPEYYTLIRNDNGYLTRDNNNKLSLQPYDKNNPNQRWWTGHVGHYDLVLTPPDGGQFLVRADRPKYQNGAIEPTPAELTDLFPELTDTSHCWNLIPADGDSKIDQDVNRYHVPDQCDSTWHNPACPGNSATWIGCQYNSQTKQCQCMHSQ